MARHGKIGLDLDGRTAIDFGVYGVPETYILDRDGRIRFRYAGALTDDILKTEILPEHIAAAAAALVSGDLSVTTGTFVPVDGGIPAAFPR